MPSFYCTSDFIRQSKKLTSDKKAGYDTLQKDICDVFKDKNIDEIFAFNDTLIVNENHKLVKLRVPNTKQNLSKSNGFRVIFLVQPKIEKVTFIYVFPKRGKFGMNSIEKEQIKTLLQTAVKEGKDNSLFEIHPHKDFILENALNQ